MACFRVEQNTELARQYFQTAALAGHRLAANRLATLLGPFSPAGKGWFKLAFTCHNEKHDAIRMYELSKFYDANSKSDGGVVPDANKAMRFLSEAAGRGDLPAANLKLGKRSLLDVAPSLLNDPDSFEELDAAFLEGLRFLEVAAKHTSNFSNDPGLDAYYANASDHAAFFLGVIHASGMAGTLVDCEVAYQWFSESAMPASTADDWEDLAPGVTNLAAAAGAEKEKQWVALTQALPALMVDGSMQQMWERVAHRHGGSPPSSVEIKRLFVEQSARQPAPQQQQQNEEEKVVVAEEGQKTRLSDSAVSIHGATMPEASWPLEDDAAAGVNGFDLDDCGVKKPKSLKDVDVTVALNEAIASTTSILDSHALVEVFLTKYLTGAEVIIDTPANPRLHGRTATIDEEQDEVHDGLLDTKAPQSKNAVGTVRVRVHSSIGNRASFVERIHPDDLVPVKEYNAKKKAQASSSARKQSSARKKASEGQHPSGCWIF